MMDERSRRNGVSPQPQPQLLELIPNERSEWHDMRGEDRKLELSLAPPGGEQHWSLKSERDDSLLSLGYNNNGFQIHKSMAVMGKDASQPPCCSKLIHHLQNNAIADKKVFSSSPSSAPPANTAVPNTSQKRTAPGPVVGWPPIRSFRKNLASSSSSKPPTPPPDQPNNKAASGKKPVENNYGKGMFVKINMDGVPIGRKVDLNAYHTYENLSTAVDHLFRGLLAAQRDSSGGGVQNKQLEDEKPITGLLDGSGEYTLVYEDNEGDRMLVGDVPWHMFVSTVKRLRVLKSTELSAFTLGGKQDKETT